MATTTTNIQSHAAEALVHILDMSGLPEATWYVYPRRLGAELQGQIAGLPLADAHAAVDTFMLALGLSPQPERHVPGDASCAAFMKVHASGEYMGVTVSVWCAGEMDGAR